MSENTPHPKLKQLNQFVGVWQTKGTMKMPDGSTVDINGTDSYEWLSGKFFMIHRVVDVQMGSFVANAIEIIGYDVSKQKFFMQSYDNHGNTEIMYSHIENNTWIFQGKTTRFLGSFSNDGCTLAGRWEQLNDSENWQPWMDITLSKK